MCTGADALYVTCRSPLSDHLGSTVGLLDTSGNLVPNSKTAYWPYGAVRSGGPITQTDKLYTGQQIESGDAALGLYNYKARFYSAYTGRFVSADPRTKDGLNRYEYSRDNPLRYNDPSGLDAASDLRDLYNAFLWSGLSEGECGNEWYTRTLPSGKQSWLEVDKSGKIVDGGENDPGAFRQWDPVKERLVEPPDANAPPQEDQPTSEPAAEPPEGTFLGAPL